MADFVIDRNEFYLSYEWLIAYGIRRTAIEQWSKRNISCVISVERKSFVSYLSIPEPTRKKLPSLEELKRLESKQRKESPNCFIRIFWNTCSALIPMDLFNFAKYT